MAITRSAVIVVLFSTVSWSCPPGSIPWEGVCAEEIQPEQAPSVKPSDEKPPKDKMPSWERADVKVIDVPSMAADDAKQDAEKRDSDNTGKKAAHIK